MGSCQSIDNRREGRKDNRGNQIRKSENVVSRRGAGWTQDGGRASRLQHAVPEGDDHDHLNIASHSKAQELLNAPDQDAEHQYELAMAHLDGTCGLDRSVDEAIRCLRCATKHGHKRAPQVLADIYYNDLNGALGDKSEVSSLYSKKLDLKSISHEHKSKAGIEGKQRKQSPVAVDQTQRKSAVRRSSWMIRKMVKMMSDEDIISDSDPFESFAAAEGHNGYEHLRFEETVRMGQMFEESTVGEDTSAMIFQRMKKAADQGIGSAQLEVGIMYRDGKGVKRSPECAFRYLKSAADQGLGSAKLHVGEMYYTGSGTKKDMKRAVCYFKLACDSNVIGAKQRMEEARVELRRHELILAPHDDAESQYQIGIAYLEGSLGFMRSDREAANRLQLAVDQGHPLACLRLAYMISSGMYGIPQRLSDAAKLYKMSADRGIAEAQNSIAHMLHHGKGVKRNKVEAARYYQLAADAGIANAQYQLARLLEKGIYIPLDEEMSAHYCQLAADQGHEKARARIGQITAKIQARIHANNIGTVSTWMNRENHSVKLDCNLIASERGDARAQSELGFQLYHGLGVCRDVDLSIKYSILAAKQGESSAILRLGIMNFSQGKYEAALELLRMDRQSAIARSYLGRLYLQTYCHDTHESILDEDKSQEGVTVRDESIAIYLFRLVPTLAFHDAGNFFHEFTRSAQGQ